MLVRVQHATARDLEHAHPPSKFFRDCCCWNHFWSKQCMLYGAQTTDFYMHKYLLFLPIMPYSTIVLASQLFASLVCHTDISRCVLASYETNLSPEEWQLVGGRLGDLVAVFSQVLTCAMSPANMHAMHVLVLSGRLLAMVLIGDTKQAISEGKSGLVETRVTGQAATVLMQSGDQKVVGGAICHQQWKAFQSRTFLSLFLPSHTTYSPPCCSFKCKSVNSNKHYKLPSASHMVSDTSACR